MKNKGMKKWMKGNGNLYRLANQGEVETRDKNIVLCGRNWIIRPMAD